MNKTLEFILKKYNVNWDGKTQIIELPNSRWDSYVSLLKELDFNSGVEMGVCDGRFSQALCSANPNLKLTGVDAWKVYDGYVDYATDFLEVRAYKRAIERSNKFGFKIIKAWSLDAVKEFEDESLDFVFIDGNHDFRHVTDDVDEWSKKIKRGGIVSGHDFFKNYHEHYGVREAIPAWCDAHRIKPLFIFTKDKCPSWMYIKE